MGSRFVFGRWRDDPFDVRVEFQRGRNGFDRVRSRHGEANLIQFANKMFAFGVETADTLRTDQFARLLHVDLRLDEQRVEPIEKEFPSQDFHVGIVA